MLRRINADEDARQSRTYAVATPRTGKTAPASPQLKGRPVNPLGTAARAARAAAAPTRDTVTEVVRDTPKPTPAPVKAPTPAAAPHTGTCWVCLNTECPAKFKLFKAKDTPALCATCGMQAGHCLITFPPTVTATFALKPSAEALAALAQAKADEERIKAEAKAATPRTAGQDVPSRPLTPAEEAGEADDLIEAVEAHMDQLIEARIKYQDEDLDDEPRLFEAAVIWLSRYKGDDTFLNSVRRGGLSSMSQAQARGVLNTWKRERAAARRQNGGK